MGESKNREIARDDTGCLTECAPSDITNGVIVLRIITLMLFLFPVLNTLMVAWSLYFKLPLGPWIVPVVFVLSSVISFCCFHQRSLIFRSGAIVLGGVLVVVAFSLSDIFQQLSSDAMSYHYPATFGIARGWNPIWDPWAWGVFGDLESYLPMSSHLTVFPKSHWYASASLYLFSGSIFTGHALDWIFLLSVVLFSFDICHRRFCSFGWVAVIFAITIAFNPIAMGELMSGYIDGVVASVMTIFVMGMLGLLYRFDVYYLLITVTAFHYCFTTKTTGAAIIGLLLLGFFLLLFLRSSYCAKRLFQFLLLGGLVFLPCYLNPYLSNLIKHHNPIYPAFVGDYTDCYVKSRYLLGITGKNNIESFYETQIGSNSPLRKPGVMWSIDRFDYSYCQSEGENSAFGPLYGFLFLAVLAVYLSLLYKMKFFELAFCLPVFLSVIVFPEPWYGRFIPQAWLIVVLPCLFAVKTFNSKSPFWGGAVIITVGLLFNSLMLTYVCLVRARACCVKNSERIALLEPYIDKGVTDWNYYTFEHQGSMATYQFLAEDRWGSDVKFNLHKKSPPKNRLVIPFKQARVWPIPDKYFSKLSEKESLYPVSSAGPEVSFHLDMMLGPGWYLREEGIVWSSEKAQLFLPTIDEPGTYRALVSFFVLGASEDHPVHVIFRKDSPVSDPFEAVVLKEIHSQVVAVDIDSDSPVVSLYIEAPDACSPQSLGMNLDKRILGIALLEIKLEKVGENSDE